MDLNGVPSYIEATTTSLARTSEFLAAMSAYRSTFPAHQRLVQAVITPRFVPTCSTELLTGLAGLAKEHGVRVQTHSCESEDMVAWSKGMWDGKDDAVVLDEVSQSGSYYRK